jgi:hypothetical protein
MKTYKRTLRKRKTIKYAKILTAILLIAAIASILIFVFVYNPNAPAQKPKLPAVDYFVFTELTAEYVPVGNTDKMIKVTFFHLNMTPVGGNATNLHLEVGGYTDPLDANLYWPKIVNGTSESVEVSLVGERLITKTGTTYPIRIRLYCDEAEGYVTLQIPENMVFPI